MLNHLKIKYKFYDAYVQVALQVLADIKFLQGIFFISISVFYMFFLIITECLISALAIIKTVTTEKIQKINCIVLIIIFFSKLGSVEGLAMPLSKGERFFFGIITRHIPF